jgi:hypothetical protein
MPPNMVNFVSGCSPQQINELLQAINATQAQTLQRNVNVERHTNTAMSPSKPVGIKKQQSANQSPRAAKVSPEKVAKRPLNSFMAFRSEFCQLTISRLCC